MTLSPRVLLRNMLKQWEIATRDARDFFPFELLLDELLFHGDVRFDDYSPRQPATFPKRLLRWLENVPDGPQRRHLFRLLQWLVFVDHHQMASLYRDAYRRVITTWATQAISADEHAAPDFDARLRDRLRGYRFLSITPSFKYVDFRNANDLSGIAQCLVLGEDLAAVPAIIATTISAGCRGLVVLEDFVGRGKQAGKVLAALRRATPEVIPILFAPIMALEDGIIRLRTRAELAGVLIAPVLTLSTQDCLATEVRPGEPDDFLYFRSIVKSTSKRVLRRLDKHDDAPKDPFGYESSGALVVPFHNTPNNTLPLIHHKAPDWDPLFRRIHHKQD